MEKLISAEPSGSCRSPGHSGEKHPFGDSKNGKVWGCPLLWVTEVCLGGNSGRCFVISSQGNQYSAGPEKQDYLGAAGFLSEAALVISLIYDAIR